MVAMLISLVIGLLFVWWIGVIVFVIGLTVIFGFRRREVVEQCSIPEDEQATKELLDWNEWEVTHGPSAPGIANPSRRDD